MPSFSAFRRKSTELLTQVPVVENRFRLVQNQSQLGGIDRVSGVGFTLARMGKELGRPEALLTGRIFTLRPLLENKKAD